MEARKGKAEESKYGGTVNLPQTDFQQRANAPKREPEIQQMWNDMKIYEKLAAENPGPIFTLHDGPPYANGDLHIGHALNKILKDVINRYRILKGDKVNYVPGWDCHGLPIELKVLQSMKSKERQGLTPLDIRRKAKDFAVETVGKQRESFKRYGIWADWENPYLTLKPDYEAEQMQVFADMLKNGHIYRGRKPVHWSPSSRTALAEAELEYPEGHTSRSIYVGFPVVKPSEALTALQGERDLSVAVWTTTPWTIPANLAVAVNGELKYSVVAHPAMDAKKAYVVATGLLEEFGKKMGLQEEDKFEILGEFSGEEIAGTTYKHPLYERESPVVIGGDYITTDSGTGLVHTAPGHGQEDYQTGLKYGLEILAPVDDAGRFTEEAGARFEGKSVLGDGNQEVITALNETGTLLKEEGYVHKYPYDWRTKKPTIFRATSQWFASIDGFRDNVLKEIEQVKWVPATGQNRIRSFCESRGDWCISRQRAWGVPIPVFYDTTTGEPLMTEETIQHIIGIVREKGTDAWFEMTEEELLPASYAEEARDGKWRKGTDTMDVWFDSGTSWRGVANAREELAYPADLYLEGSDQHRGWFQSSLLTSVASKGQAPYKSVLTHGFVLDEKGYKMSKSLGNVVNPLEVIEGGSNKKAKPAYGADVLRLWASSVDFSGDVSIGDGIVKQVADSYRKLRNTVRYIIGNLHDYDEEKHAVKLEDLPAVDRYILARLSETMKEVEQAYDKYDFANAVQALTRFCVSDLSNFYLDTAKDRLYIPELSNPRRRSCQTVLKVLLDSLTQALAPILPHLAEDLHFNLPAQQKKQGSSVFENRWTVPEFARDEATDGDIGLARLLRNDVNKVLEAARQAKTLGASSEAEVLLYCGGGAEQARESLERLMKSQNEVDNLQYLLLVSGVRFVDSEEEITSAPHQSEGDTETGVKVGVQRYVGVRCERCWNHFPETEFDVNSEFPDVCQRCVAALQAQNGIEESNNAVVAHAA